MLKNRCFAIYKDNDIYAYISVKKDFYTEGILCDSKDLLIGNFTFYNNFNCFIFDNKKIDSYLNAISFESKKEDWYDVSGDMSSRKFNLIKFIEMDEYFSVYKNKDSIIEEGYSFKEVTDEKIIADINFLIRNSIRCLNDEYKKLYDMLKRKRYGNLRELIYDMVHPPECMSKERQEKFKVPEDLLLELKEYLKIVKPEDPNEKEKQKQSELILKKKRKKNKHKKYNY